MNKNFWNKVNGLEELAEKTSQEIQEDKSWGTIEQLVNKYYTVANPAMILEMIAELKRLEKEADWLAEEVASVYKSEFEGTMDLLDASGWREAARKSVMENKNV